MTDVPSPRKGPRTIRALVVVAVVLAVILAWIVTGSGSSGEVETVPGVEGATAQLDAALGAGTPVYILIHSET